jgi:hypothetical protein
VKRLIVFDLDGTLAGSKSPLDADLSKLLYDLLLLVKVAVISGGDWPQFEEQLLSKLPNDERLVNLSLLPPCGTKFYRYDAAAWEQIYSEDFTTVERDNILSSLRRRSTSRTSNLQIQQIMGRTNRRPPFMIFSVFCKP